MSLDRDTVLRVLERLHRAQNAFYAGGEGDELRALLTEDVVWHVPGSNAIAGRYAGVDAVMGYFARRRALASATFRLHPGEVLTGNGDHVAVLTDGTAIVDGRERRWSTVGLYRFRGERVAACWLLPLDAAAFDAIWSAREQAAGPDDAAAPRRVPRERR
jgi:ketosteroid isomerase-like protein